LRRTATNITRHGVKSVNLTVIIYCCFYIRRTCIACDVSLWPWPLILQRL